MCEIAGITFNHNVWNAPVPQLNIKIKELEESSSGAIVFQTHTLHKTKGDLNGWKLYDWGSINNTGLCNSGVDSLLHIIEFNQKLITKPIFLSLYGNEEEMEKMIYQINEFSFKVPVLIEWNCSLFHFGEINYNKSFSKLKSFSNYPMGVKIDYNQNPPEGVDFITCINTIDGVGGQYIQEKAIEKVTKMRQMYPNTPIIGVGGVETIVDIEKFIKAGATAVEIGTAFLRYGTDVFMTKQDILNEFVETGKVWTLKNKQLSKYNVNFKKVYSRPFLWKQLVSMVVDKVKDLEFDVICGVPIDAIPLATAVAEKMKKPFILCKKTEKTYNDIYTVDGEFKKGDVCLLLEDVVIMEESFNKITKDLTDKGIEYVYGMSLFNYGNHSDIESLYTKKDIQFNPKERLEQIIQRKKTNICFAADMYDGDDILHTITCVGPYICMVKLHLDMLKNIPYSFYSILHNYAEEYDFMIMEDRKYMDHGNIILKQIVAIKQKLQIDFVSVHASVGSTAIDFIPKDIGVFLVTDISKDSVSVPSFKHDRIVGIMSEKEREYDDLLYMSSDHLQQKEHNKDVDIIVLGKQLYNSEYPVDEIKKYIDINIE